MGTERPAASRAQRCAVVLVAALACGATARGVPAPAGDEDGTKPLPTIEILEELAGEIGREVLPSIPGDTAAAVVLDIEPTENTWFVAAGLTKGLIPRRVVREPGTGAALAVAAGIRSMGVAYENVRREGLFGDRELTRTVFMEADISVVDRTSGEILHRAAVRRSRQDDVLVEDIPRLEEPGLKWTTANVPPEGFFSSVLEPVITIGAIAVAVILLFTVRS
jgi:hypothetical protein